MYRFSILFLLIVSVYSCKPDTKTKELATAPQTDSLKPGVTIDPVTGIKTITFERPAADKQRPPISGVLNLIGKKPNEVNLFAQFGLKERISQIMGQSNVEFTKDWNEETVLAKDGEIVYATGCKSGDCKSNKYLLILDTKQNGINIYNWKGSKMRTFEEDNTIIGLPYEMQDFVDAILSAQEK